MDSIEATNWLAHRWPIKLKTRQYGVWTIHTGMVDGLNIGQAMSRADYDAWLLKQRPVCLARMIASRTEVHPALVLVVAGEYRLGRIPADLWCGYDATAVQEMPPLHVLSAKARAMFPAWPNALIRIVRQDQRHTIDLRPAPDARGPRLRAVA